MMNIINRLLEWFKSIFWKEEMELTLVGLQYSGKTTFVNVIAVIHNDVFILLLLIFLLLKAISVMFSYLFEMFFVYNFYWHNPSLCLFFIVVIIFIYVPNFHINLSENTLCFCFSRDSLRRT